MQVQRKKQCQDDKKDKLDTKHNTQTLWPTAFIQMQSKLFVVGN